MQAALATFVDIWQQDEVITKAYDHCTFEMISICF